MNTGNSGLIAAILIAFILFFIINLVVKKKVKKSPRPSEITTLSIILGLGVITQIYSFVTLSKISFNSPVAILNFFLGIIWLIGIWKMKRWGALGYIVSALLTQFYLFTQGVLTIYSILLLFPILILLYHFRKMN